MEEPSSPLLLAVHAGAGFHHPAESCKLRTLCKKACEEGIKILQDGGSCNEATTAAISILEDSPLTNAGVGSNLSLHGTVECDASLMDGAGGFGSIGAVQGICNPIRLASELLRGSSAGLLPLGRVPPIALVGEGASLWASQHGVPMCSSEDELITDRARMVYLNHRARLDAAAAGTMTAANETPFSPSPSFSPSPPSPPSPLDTIGAVCVDGRGGVCAGSSSGGISLKVPGRVGQAAMFGCGCWADCTPSLLSRGVACSTSGTGEYLIKTLLAKTCSDAVRESDMTAVSLQRAMNKKFLQSRLLAGVEDKLAGCIILNVLPIGAIDLCWGHTTQSMCVGYAAIKRDSKGEEEPLYHPTALISRLENTDQVGRTVQIGGVCFSR